MPAWPTTLPALSQLSGYTETPPDKTIASPMDFGPPKIRRRFTANVRPISGVLTMTQAQVEILDSFFDNDLAGGALTVQSTHPRTDVAIDAYLQKPTYRDIGGDLMQVDISLVVMP